MRLHYLVLVVAGLATKGLAADAPVLAPVEGWVAPVRIPKPKADHDKAAVQILLIDRQDRVVEGGTDVYSETAMLIQTPEGLQFAGNVALDWKPETDTLVVHKVHILRNGHTTDVLGKGQNFTVLRRETNLERAMLDGMLTAALQPEGLQVGDIVNVAFTLKRRDPLWATHASAVARDLQGAPIRRLYLRQLWPNGRTIRWHATPDLPKPKLSRSADTTELVLDAENVQPAVVPLGAPPRFAEVGQLETTEFASWGDLAALVAPLFDKVAVITAGSDLDAQAKKIAANYSDPKLRAAAALRLVQDQIRYVSLAMGNGGVVPASAEQTWSRRFGDCKGKAAVLVALLRTLGFTAEPALVNTTRGDGLNNRLPTPDAFDHVIVRAVVAGQTYWLDGTRLGDRSLDTVVVPAFRWALPLRTSGAQLEPLAVAPLALPSVEATVVYDATEGLDVPAPVEAMLTMRGDLATFLHIQLNNLPAADRQRALEEIWKQHYDRLKPKSTRFDFDERDGALKLSLTGTAELEWDDSASGRQLRIRSASLPWRAEFKRPAHQDQSAPWALPFPMHMATRETIKLPRQPGFGVVGVDIDRNIGGILFRRKTALANDEFTSEASFRTEAAELAAKEAPAVAKALAELAEQHVYVRAPWTYRQTKGDLAQLASGTPTTAEEYLNRGISFLNGHDWDSAVRNLSQAISLNPKHSYAYANRGMARVWKYEDDAAAADFANALELDPSNWVALQGRGVLHTRAERFDAAIADYTRAIEFNQNNIWALAQRVDAYVITGAVEKAFADIDTLVKLEPENVRYSAMRANLLNQLGRSDEAIAFLTKLIEQRPNDADVIRLRASALVALKRHAEARPDYDRIVALQPRATNYLQRAEFRPASERAAAFDDVATAAKLEPSSTSPHRIRAWLHTEDRAYDIAIAEIDKQLAGAKSKQARVDLLGVRSYVKEKAGRLDQAIADLEAALTLTDDDASILNGLCWVKATYGKKLESAVENCSAALKIDPTNSNIYDSRGLANLKLGKLDAASADFTKALRIDPYQANALYGRGIVRLRQGAAAAGQADIEKAKRLNREIEVEYAEYGLKP